MDKLNITDLDKLKITKVKPWVVYFTYDGQRYFLHDDSDEDRSTGLYKKNDRNIELIGAAITLSFPSHFIRVKKNIKEPKGYPTLNVVHNQIDKEYFVKRLTREGIIDSLFNKDVEDLELDINSLKDLIKRYQNKIEKVRKIIKDVEEEFYGNSKD